MKPNATKTLGCAIGLLLVAFSLSSYGQTPLRAKPSLLNPTYCGAFLFTDSLASCLPNQSKPISTNTLITEHSEPSLPNVSKPNVQDNSSTSHTTQFLKEWSGVIAILFSLVVPLLSHLHFRKNRHHSIRDDFWVRQVAYPYVLEPCLTFIDWCSTTLSNIEPNAENFCIDKVRKEFRLQHTSVKLKINVLSALEGNEYPGHFKALRKSIHSNFSTPKANANDMQHPLYNQFQVSLEVIEDSFIQCLAEVSSQDYCGYGLDQTKIAISNEIPVLISALYKWQQRL